METKWTKEQLETAKAFMSTWRILGEIGRKDIPYNEDDPNAFYDAIEKRLDELLNTPEPEVKFARITIGMPVWARFITEDHNGHVSAWSDRPMALPILGKWMRPEGSQCKYEHLADSNDPDPHWEKCIWTVEEFCERNK